MSKSPESTVSARERTVLATVIRGYVDSARPVGSRWVARHSGLGLSSASIRNCMMELEGKGLLTHLHTSGGRIPTNAGYRLFVDSVMKRTRLGRRTERAIDETLSGERFGSLETLLNEVCILLGQFSDQLSVVLSPRYDCSRVHRIDLNQVDERRLLVVFRMSSGLERTVIVALEGEIDSDDVHPTLQIMNAAAQGKTLAELIALRDDEEMRVRTRGRKLTGAVFQGAAELRTGEVNDHFHLWGTSNILSQPEFEDRRRLQRIFRALEEKDVIYGLFEPTRHRKSVCVTIGEENAVEELRHCSVVAGSYRFGELGGSVGIIGPTRMPYDYMVSLVDYVARAVGGVLVRN